MSIYSQKPLDFAALATVSLYGRGGKVNTGMFADPTAPDLLGRMPRILAVDSLRAVIDRLREAREKRRTILWGFGGHVIKTGLAPTLLHLADHGYATGFCTNGSGSIHDFEIALAGYTSEDVEAVLPNGAFGSAEETGREMNAAIAEGARDGIGMGEALGRHLQSKADQRFAPFSLLHGAYSRGLPVTVHVAVGTDTPHVHPQADGAAIGQTTYQDFRLLCDVIRDLDDGGVYLNVGSAVVLPEVFLKAVSVVRNLGFPLGRFTTANFDFLQHYRPTANVVKRPHANAGGTGYALTGHHEILIPLLASLLLDPSA